MYAVGGLSYEEKKVGTIFGFLRQILKLSEQFRTKDFIFCWDSKQSYRKLISEDYKANRRKGLSEGEIEDFEIAYSQFDELRDKVLPYMGFKNIFHQTGYEADDLIAWIVMRFPDATVIVSGDHDLFQLLVNNKFCPVAMYNFKVLNDETRFTEDWFGLKPKDWIKVKAIAGCATDNVIGVVGVGELTAAKYLAGILKSGKKVAAIEGAEDLIAFNHRLVGLPFVGRKAIKIGGLQEDQISADKFRVTFGQYGFRSLISEEGSKGWLDSFFGGARG